MSKLNIGFCGIDETPIFSRVGKALIPNSNYVEISLALSDGSVARHGICNKCINDLTDKKIQALFNRIKESWAESMVGWASDKQFSKMRALEIKAYNPDEAITINKYKEVKEIEFKEHLKQTKEQKDIAIELEEVLES